MKNLSQTENNKGLPEAQSPTIKPPRKPTNQPRPRPPQTHKHTVAVSDVTLHQQHKGNVAFTFCGENNRPLELPLNQNSDVNKQLINDQSKHAAFYL